MKRFKIFFLALALFAFLPLGARAALVVQSYAQGSVPMTYETSTVNVQKAGDVSARLADARVQLENHQRSLAMMQEYVERLHQEHNAQVIANAKADMNGKRLKNDIIAAEKAQAKKNAEYEATRAEWIAKINERERSIIADQELISELTSNTQTTVKTASCPSNSTSNGSMCACMAGYTAKGGSCVPAKDVCVQDHGISAYFNPDTQSCHYCDTADQVFDGIRCVQTVSSPAPKVLGSKDCAFGFGWNDYLGTCIAVAPGTATPKKEAVVVDQATSTVKYATALYRMNVRASGSINGKKLGTVNAKYRFEVVDDSGEWARVKYGKGDGWVKKSLVMVE